MTREENYLYQLVKNTIPKGTSKKLPKTMTTVKWVQNLKKCLTAKYIGYTVDMHNPMNNHWHAVILNGALLDRAVEFMLIHEITARLHIITKDPCRLPHSYDTECMRDRQRVLEYFLPSKLKNQEFV